MRKSGCGRQKWIRPIRQAQGRLRDEATKGGCREMSRFVIPACKSAERTHGEGARCKRWRGKEMREEDKETRRQGDGEMQKSVFDPEAQTRRECGMQNEERRKRARQSAAGVCKICETNPRRFGQDALPNPCPEQSRRVALGRYFLARFTAVS